jgi:hypothetical protein
MTGEKYTYSIMLHGIYAGTAVASDKRNKSESSHTLVVCLQHFFVNKIYIVN